MSLIEAATCYTVFFFGQKWKKINNQIGKNLVFFEVYFMSPKT